MNTSGPIKILFLEHDPHDLELLQYELKKGGINFLAAVAQSEAEYEDALRNFLPDIILSDYSLPVYDGPGAFEMREQIAPDTPFIFVSGTIEEENSIEFITKGVTDYALKDKLFTLCTKVKRAIKEAREKQQKNKTTIELAQSERRLARAQQLARMGSWELELDTDALIFSEEAARIFEILPTHKTLSFELWSSFIHPDDKPSLLLKIQDARNFLKESSFNYRIIGRNGMIKHIYTESKVEFDSSGKCTLLYGILRDITETKLAEFERIKMLEELIRRNKDLEQFAYIVSHNLRASVANIIGAGKLMKNPGLSSEKKEMVAQGLHASITKLDEVIKDLNSILQVQHPIDERNEIIRFSQFVRDIKISLKSLVERNNIIIIADFTEVDELLTIKSYLYSVFYNLIYNSIKYRQAAVPCIIEIRSRFINDKIELTFKDNGMGIDLQRKGDQVFGLYKRFHANIEGKGMGLFMVKTQVEVLGGKISLQSEVNKGTEFKIQFEK